ncbi:methyltransferase [Marinibactrum halimedae]|uniref:Methyltransferase n=1 Tax=Marinibactrum halimedae TaxID=1444977 RepID=A0AA37T951_9GAMM|nr:methyltransferase [Marinibactrum halimedae]MCD9461085.1 SAM-dependent methyltransferase [Marinibactrum halimedae]GLS25735.1 methyltransferase [Marinibactrum halimedae]
MNTPTLESHFLSLTHYLQNFSYLWKPVPFYHLIENQPLSWAENNPDLTDFLKALSNSDIQHLTNDSNHLRNALHKFIPGLAAINETIQLLENPLPVPHTHFTPDKFSHTHIPGRKWEQTLAFSQSLPEVDSPILDWCSGKGHLAGLLFQRFQQPVQCLEYDEILCRQGNELAEKKQQSLEFIHHDVMNPLPDNVNANASFYTALHACGDLHRQAVETCIHHHAPGIAFSPCCFHKINTDFYRPFSQLAKDSFSPSNSAPFWLTRKDLHLAVQQTVTAGKREKIARRREKVYRFALRQWCHQQSIPEREENTLCQKKMSKKLFNQSFPEFIASIFQNETTLLDLNARLHNNNPQLWPSALREGVRNYRWNERAELVRKCFSRPLEAWLILDRALRLEEAGLNVSVGTFCRYQATPRNFMIMAMQAGK